MAPGAGLHRRPVGGRGRGLPPAAAALRRRRRAGRHAAGPGGQRPAGGGGRTPADPRPGEHHPRHGVDGPERRSAVRVGGRRLHRPRRPLVEPGQRRVDEPGALVRTRAGHRRLQRLLGLPRRAVPRWRHGGRRRPVVARPGRRRRWPGRGARRTAGTEDRSRRSRADAGSLTEPLRSTGRAVGRTVSGEALVLALISIVRPTTAAAVWAMLVGARPRRLLTTYLLAGMAVSLTVGIAAVLLLGGVFSPRAVPGRRGVLLIVLGIVALVTAVAARLGRLQRFRPAEAVPGSRSRQLSPLGAATAGVLTHLPGVFYLAGLSAIAGTGAAAGEEVLQIVVYNLVWFAPAIVALGVCLYGTVPSADRLARPVTWARAHQEVLLVACFGVVGVWLIAKGISSLG